MIRRKLGANGAITVLLLQVRGAPDKLVRCIVIDENRGGSADIAGRAVHRLVILEVRHRRNFNALDNTVLDGDLRIAINLAECQREGAQIDLKIGPRAVIEFIAQRPVRGTHNHGGGGCNQECGANNGLGAEFKSEEGERAPVQPECHAARS